MIRIARVVPAVVVIGWLGVFAAAAQPAAPVITYPPDGAVNIRWNPTIFLSVFTDPTNALSTQEDFEVEIATSGSFGGDVVWRSHPGSGAGMAMHVAADSGLFQNALSCANQLEAGTQYFVRARRKARGGAFSNFSSTSSFSTVNYDGKIRFLTPGGSDTGDCDQPGTPCRSLAYVLTRVDPGDQVVMGAGTYLTAEDEIDFNDVTDRVWIRGESPQNRPIIKANYPSPGASVFGKLSGMKDVILQDLRFEGQDGCCNAGAGRRYIMVVRGNPERVTWRNIEFAKGMQVTGNLVATGVGSLDTLVDRCVFNGQPTNGVIQTYGTSTTSTGYQEVRPTFLTVRNTTFDQLTEHLDLTSSEDVLLENILMNRGINHPFRQKGVNRNWTVRRLLIGDGLEGWSIAAGDSTVFNLVIESSTITHGMAISDNANEPGTIGYFVMRNNVFIRPTATGPTWQITDCITFCPGGDILNTATDRIDFDYNTYWHDSTGNPLIDFDGTLYSRRGSGASSNYDAWLARGYDANSPFALYNGTEKEPVNPVLTRVPEGDPSVRTDPTLTPLSPAIDVGDPVSHVVPSGGARVDLGQVEFLSAPIVTTLSPAPGDECVPSSVTSVSVLVEDRQQAIDQGSIQMRINGNIVAPTISGSGSSITLSAPIPGAIPADGIVRVDVDASDTDAPANMTTFSSCFSRAPSPPTGVAAN